MKKYARKAVYTYYRMNIRFKNDEEAELIKKFYHVPKKNQVIKKLLVDYLNTIEIKKKDKTSNSSDLEQK